MKCKCVRLTGLYKDGELPEHFQHVRLLPSPDSNALLKSEMSDRQSDAAFMHLRQSEQAMWRHRGVTCVLCAIHGVHARQKEGSKIGLYGPGRWRTDAGIDGWSRTESVLTTSEYGPSLQKGRVDMSKCHLQSDVSAAWTLL
ncbi:uncharacterized protein LOC144050745 isoform X3 [Vanacampus margaritifer]